MNRLTIGLWLALAAAVAGCTSERISSELEAEAVVACGVAIEKRLGRELPRGWQYLKVEDDDEASVQAWPPGADSESAPPDYTCRVVPDEGSPSGVRITDVVDDAGSR
jgi:hypothetical protein